MTGTARPEDRRLCILFHETEILGAGMSLLRVLEPLAAHGWTGVGWFPGDGPLVDETAATLALQGQWKKPIAFSVQGWRTPPGPWSRLRETPGYLRAFAGWLRRVRPHVIHANSLLLLPEATIARTLGVPVVLHVHELHQPGRKRDATIRWASAVADVLVGVSTPVSEMLVEHAGHTPVVTVYNGVPLVDRGRPADGPFVVGSVGYVSRTKGTDVFLEAAELALRERPQLRFEHVGQPRLWGDDEFDRSVEEAATSPVLREALTLRGRADVPDALTSWRIFVLASRREGFPLSTLEAMAAGLPVIATEVGGVPEQITHLETGVLVPPDDAPAIADWIVRLHDDEALRLRLGDAASEKVRASFTLTAQAEGLHAAYELALRRRAGRSRRVRRRAAA